MIIFRILCHFLTARVDHAIKKIAKIKKISPNRTEKSSVQNKRFNWQNFRYVGQLI